VEPVTGKNFFSRRAFLAVYESLGQSPMEKAEVKRIARYIEELERGLGRWDGQGMATYRHLIKLHLTIERLAETTCAADNRQLQPTLTVLENKARRCKRRIEKRLALHS
jgi:hypothetical protein